MKTETDPTPAPRYLKQLAYSRGVSFIPSTNQVEASQLIDQLKGQGFIAVISLCHELHRT